VVLIRLLNVAMLLVPLLQTYALLLIVQELVSLVLEVVVRLLTVNALLVKLVQQVMFGAQMDLADHLAMALIEITVLSASTPTTIVQIKKVDFNVLKILLIVLKLQLAHTIVLFVAWIVPARILLSTAHPHLLILQAKKLVLRTLGPTVV
jgi:hypothetical protein